MPSCFYNTDEIPKLKLILYIPLLLLLVLYYIFQDVALVAVTDRQEYSVALCDNSLTLRSLATLFRQ